VAHWTLISGLYRIGTLSGTPTSHRNHPPAGVSGALCGVLKFRVLLICFWSFPRRDPFVAVYLVATFPSEISIQYRATCTGLLTPRWILIRYWLRSVLVRPPFSANSPHLFVLFAHCLLSAPSRPLRMEILDDMDLEDPDITTKTTGKGYRTSTPDTQQQLYDWSRYFTSFKDRSISATNAERHNSGSVSVSSVNGTTMYQHDALYQQRKDDSDPNTRENGFPGLIGTSHSQGPQYVDSSISYNVRQGLDMTSAHSMANAVPTDSELRLSYGDQLEVQIWNIGQSSLENPHSQQVDHLAAAHGHCLPRQGSQPMPNACRSPRIRSDISAYDALNRCGPIFQGYERYTEGLDDHACCHGLTRSTSAIPRGYVGPLRGKEQGPQESSQTLDDSFSLSGPLPLNSASDQRTRVCFSGTQAADYLSNEETSLMPSWVPNMAEYSALKADCLSFPHPEPVQNAMDMPFLEELFTIEGTPFQPLEFASHEKQEMNPPQRMDCEIAPGPRTGQVANLGITSASLKCRGTLRITDPGPQCRFSSENTAGHRSANST
jgi:hypothetical protein